MTSLRVWILAIALCVFAPLVFAQAQPDCDLLIRNGRLVDGGSTPWYVADVAIKSGRIIKIGRLGHFQARRVVEAAGLYVAPGFIDMMGQTATPFLTDSRAGLNLLSQGITTILAGEGRSAAPLSESEARTAGWQTMREYLALLEAQGMPLNVVQTVGHTQVRRIVVGNQDRIPTAGEREKMKSLVQEAMEAGAVGVSTALIYPPAIYAKTEEIAELCRVAGQYGGRYFTHLRNEGRHLLEAIDEALSIAKSANTPVHIFHLKAAGRANWSQMGLAIARIKAARTSQLEVDADIYPYINNGLQLESFIHPRHSAEGPERFRQKLALPLERAEMRREMEEDEHWENWFLHIGRDWNRLILGAIKLPAYQAFNGRSLGEIAKLSDRDPWDVFWEILGAGAFAMPQSMSEANLVAAMHEGFVSFCTDVGPVADSAVASHPRGYGSFPRVLSSYVRKLGILSLEQAVAKMTSLAANQILAFDRGRLAEGLAADIVVFDGELISDRATFANPSLTSEGVRCVIVNGAIAFEGGKQTSARPGRVLRGPGYQANR